MRAYGAGAAAGFGIVAALAAALRSARRDLTEDHLVLRPVLTGTTPLLWRLRRDLGLLHDEARLTAEGIGTLWIDKLELACGDAPRADVAGPLAELARQITAMQTPPAAILAEADALMDAVARALPRGLRGMLGDDPASQAALRDDLMRAGAAEVLAHLRGLEGDG
jgi:hypothetical protein